MGKVQVCANFGDGKTIEQFSKILESRMKYMKETSRGSVAAMAIATLKSVRAATKVAKTSGIKVDVKKDASLYCSCYRVGKKKVICARTVGSKTRHTGNEVIRVCGTGLRLGDMSVFRFTNNYSKKGTRYLIFAPTGSAAKQMAKKIVAKKAMQYAGLAKRAIGFLIMKTCTTNVNDIVSPKVNATAKAVTHKREAIATSKQGDGGKYALMLEDSLRYALDAIRGGRQAVDVAMKKAMNKAVSQINHKVKDGFLSKGKMPTPFPEVVKRK